MTDDDDDKPLPSIGAHIAQFVASARLEAPAQSMGTTVEKFECPLCGEAERLKTALRKIAAIENKPTGLDYEEIDEARWIACVALGDGPWRVLR